MAATSPPADAGQAGQRGEGRAAWVGKAHKRRVRSQGIGQRMSGAAPRQPHPSNSPELTGRDKPHHGCKVAEPVPLREQVNFSQHDQNFGSGSEQHAMCVNPQVTPVRKCIHL
eukprot:scaffold18904_cov112-Isochrysis_galbana.AAC.9